MVRGAGFLIVAALAVAGCDVKRGVDGFLIQGHWIGENGGQFTFYSDGTCDINGRSGKYEVLSEGRLKLTYKGLLWGESEEFLTYRILSNSTIQLDAKLLGIPVSDTFRKQ